MESNKNSIKNEISIYEKDEMLDLFREFLNVIDCKVHINDDEVIINDLLYKPILNIGGHKFTFDEDDIEINSLLGGDGTKLEIPFEFGTNDMLREIECESLGENKSFSVNKTRVDDKNNKIGFVKLKATKDVGKSIDININNSNRGIHLTFSKKANNDISCEVKMYDYNNCTDKQIEIKYKVTKSRGRYLQLFNNCINRANQDDSYSIHAVVFEKSLHYTDDIRTGYFESRYDDEDNDDLINKTQLVGDQIDLYFEDICFNSKSFVNSLKLSLEEISPTLLESILKNYPELKEFLDMIDRSENKGIITSLFTTYFIENHRTKVLEASNNFIGLK